MNTDLPRTDITITEGADYALSFQLLEDEAPVDLTGFTFQAQIRKDFLQNSPAVADFTVLLPRPIDGEILLSLTSQQTLDLFPALSASNARTRCGYWDMFSVSPAGTRSYFIGGRVAYIQTITRDAP